MAQMAGIGAAFFAALANSGPTASANSSTHSVSFTVSHLPSISPYRGRAVMATVGY